jgi:hypothetical protein
VGVEHFIHFVQLAHELLNESPAETISVPQVNRWTRVSLIRAVGRFIQQLGPA